MGTTLHTLSPNPGATKKKRRIGRGIGSGHGQTAGKGVKGQKARTGHHGARVGFEGGQMPMQRRLPKRGFKNLFRDEAFPINVGQLAKRFAAGSTVDVEALKSSGMVPKTAPRVKILGHGELEHKLTVRAHAFSGSAIEKIAQAGGAHEVLPPKKKFLGKAKSAPEATK
ncbi:MAG: 50S ribosomal protein L15 [Deltaproteobacteria bacterium]|nr:50S ribosomal protein L15 [Deltaproteobacteria bacterium]